MRKIPAEMLLLAVIALIAFAVALGISSAVSGQPAPGYPAPHGAYTTMCLDRNGTVTPAAGGAVLGSPGLTDCKVQIQPMNPASKGDVVELTAPSGHTACFVLGRRTGRP